MLKITECLQDTFLTKAKYISKEEGMYYLEQLLSVGFHEIDMGNLSPEIAESQKNSCMEFVEELKLNSSTKLLIRCNSHVLIKEYIHYKNVHIFACTFSGLESFSKKNKANESFEEVKKIAQLINDSDKTLSIALSIDFNTPHPREFLPESALFWIEKITKLGIKNIRIIDTGKHTSLTTLQNFYKQITHHFPENDFSLHLPLTASSWYEKVDTLYKIGNRNYNSSMGGWTKNTLPTEKLITFALQKKISHRLNLLAFETTYNTALKLFG